MKKKEYGISFVFNRLSMNKIGCIKSIKNSIRNGFTPEEHFEAAENIKELFEKSEVIGHWYREKNQRTESCYLFKCHIKDDVFAYMELSLFGNNEGYIDMYLSKDGE